jgi:hypothetical protein
MNHGRVFSQNAREIADKAQYTIGMNSLEMTSSLQILDDKGRERVRKMEIGTGEFNEVTKTMIRFLEPAEVRGTTLLVYDYKDKPDDMWIYLPALRKNRRIVSDEKGKSFMGSEFSNVDLSVPDPQDFSYSMLQAGNFQGKDCWKVEATPANSQVQNEYGYSKRVMWIEKNTFLTWKIESYDNRGQLLKVELFSDYHKLSGGKYFAWMMSKENLQNGRKSVMMVEKLSENMKFAESVFAPFRMPE